MAAQGRPTNHIKRQTHNAKLGEDTVYELRKQIKDLQRHLLSSKFSCGDALDGYISTKDVLARMDAMLDTIGNYNANHA